ncbi:MAG: Rid family hydrolase, partial [bacterium]|nr:Rid family hydrolase [bacterium]
MKMVQTDKAPKPIGPYSQAIRAGEFLFLSGQIAADPSANIETQTDSVL